MEKKRFCVNFCISASRYRYEEDKECYQKDKKRRRKVSLLKDLKIRKRF